MITHSAPDTPTNLAVNELKTLLEKHVGLTCEPKAYNLFTARIYEVMNDKNPIDLNGLMIGLANAIYAAINVSFCSYGYTDALRQIEYDIAQKRYSLQYPITYKRPSFTREQEDWMCYQIGEWYLEYKHTHNLGYAKEKLKERLCTEDKDNE